jgi:hypothetical protein
MLGFVIGALFVWLLPLREEQAPKPVVQTAAPAAQEPVARPRKLSEIEAVFAEWGKYAIWDQDRTEVAMWNSDAKSYADFYEVLREGDQLYFRSIPALTRPLLVHGGRPEAPLVFTETEEMRRQWIENRNQLVPGHPATK